MRRRPEEVAACKKNGLSSIQALELSPPPRAQNWCYFRSTTHIKRDTATLSFGLLLLYFVALNLEISLIFYYYNDSELKLAICRLVWCKKVLKRPSFQALERFSFVCYIAAS